jgi:DNA-binding response OmpR family regulator
LAEDEQQIGDMVAFKLGNIGHDVTRVADGDAALGRARGGGRRESGGH